MFQKLRKISGFLKILPVKSRYTLLELNSMTNTKFQLAIRYILVASLAKSIGDNVYIGKNTTFKNLNRISIGNNVSIHDLCYIDGYGKINIGDNVSIAHNSSILSTNHTWKDTDLPIKYNPVERGKVVIGNDVWIGCGVRLLSNISIGQRSVVAAGSVVNRDVESNSVYAGVPAKKIKDI
ncbi:acyltransferase [Staphylococcus simulans]|uniref:acyltransferase n=1 Tax=Staphylococcus TaxID=1279 RepID=UPI000CD19119|nr:MULTISPECIES: acyltransferase [Staphylococcus]MBO0387402.1 acyltransferase [Staphylococcus simulans]MBU6942452.1 acyltransferase [Staphylococcus sp. CWZ226]MDQ7115504.1 acyltransferase [Staphylococcus simulans]MDQ7140829.1 acyltransferase [Staphylococcus simulans]PNZ45384.1 acetyltransferase [Staphylococcus simulans]